MRRAELMLRKDKTRIQLNDAQALRPVYPAEIGLVDT